MFRRAFTPISLSLCSPHDLVTCCTEHTIWAWLDYYPICAKTFHWHNSLHFICRFYISQCSSGSVGFFQFLPIYWIQTLRLFRWASNHKVLGQLLVLMPPVFVHCFKSIPMDDLNCSSVIMEGSQIAWRTCCWHHLMNQSLQLCHFILITPQFWVRIWFPGSSCQRWPNFEEGSELNIFHRTMTHKIKIDRSSPTWRRNFQSHI